MNTIAVLQDNSDKIPEGLYLDLKKKVFSIWKSKYYSILAMKNQMRILRKSMKEYDNLTERYNNLKK